MPLIPNSPLDWLSLFRLQMTTIFRHLSRLEDGERGGGPEISPPLDIFETAERFVIEIDLPGASPEDLRVSLCCSLLIIEGQKRPAAISREMRLFCLERHYGRFCRTQEIPPGFDLNGVHARFRRGVLTISFPRLPASMPAVREVVIEQGE